MSFDWQWLVCHLLLEILRDMTQTEDPLDAERLESRLAARAGTVKSPKMRTTKRQPQPVAPSHPLTSEMSASDLAEAVRTHIREAKEYARWRRSRWSQLATASQVVVFALSATATIATGFANLSWPANLGFVAAALVTTASALEPYFNWRARWVLADESLARWHALEDSLYFYVASTPASELSTSRILDLQEQNRQIWADFSSDWVSARRGGSAPQR
ncbi:hypothetical protein [Agromyces mediolanus]|uniref:hypothetical protein n=1 Tax=Agromyces mediolanus TaxID=41986 RepID=UPI001E46ABD3|nr:hypothetical protein [Agromyces mediolanus]MCD1570746.1 hypothetical protein [Agromyces mediolanus]